jgi:hypothetical protein
MLVEIKRRLETIRRRETDRFRWLESASFKSNWNKRAPFAAALCADSRCVCDIGCGTQALRSLLPSAVRYLPADITQRTEDTILCDLNQRVLPEKYLLEADTVTMLGVLEYLFDVPWVLRSLRPFINTIVTSYNPSDMIQSGRRERGWVNDFTLDELVRMIHRAGYIVCNISLVDPDQVVVKATVPQRNSNNEAETFEN